jgi:hypothetical protein
MIFFFIVMVVGVGTLLWSAVGIVCFFRERRHETESATDVNGGPRCSQENIVVSTLLAQACFPQRVGKVCTDPMTGFFASAGRPST